MTELRITVTNTSRDGGTALTPVFAGFHDGSFDLYDRGVAASAGLEALAEDGNNSVIAGELTAADADAQSINVVGDRGPIAAGEVASARIDVDGLSNGSFVYGSMVLPSNDAFIGNGGAIQLFDASGAFLGARTIVDSGADVLDAGTEVNTERDAAFINQTGPNTGVTENGVVTAHPGFNGSAGNPGGEQIILGGTNAFGELVDPTAADFTLPGAQIATIHINEVRETAGTAGRDVIRGTAVDDIVEAGGGRDFVFGGAGYDVIDGGAGNDVLFGNAGADTLTGGEGRDFLHGGGGSDSIEGGEGRDFIIGARGDDRIDAGEDRDFVRAGRGEDIVQGGAGSDRLFGNSDSDLLDGGTGNDALFGGSHADVLLGGAGFDQLNGGTGNDTLDGGAGLDVLEGGRGDDTFVFRGGDGKDLITDFGRGADVLAIDVDGIDDFADLSSAAHETSAGTLLNFGSDGALFLRGAEIDDLADTLFL